MIFGGALILEVVLEHAAVMTQFYPELHQFFF